MKFGLVVSSDDNYYTAIYERHYSLELKEFQGMTFMSLKSVDNTPSGYSKGGTRRTLIQDRLFTGKVDNPRALIAKLALETDSDLRDRHRSGCMHSRNSAIAITAKLRARLSQPVVV